MNIFITLMFVVGSILITFGYMNVKSNSKIEYRYIPRSLYSYQINPLPLRKIFNKMFNSRSSWSTYPHGHNSHYKKTFMPSFSK